MGSCALRSNAKEKTRVCPIIEVESVRNAEMIFNANNEFSIMKGPSIKVSSEYLNNLKLDKVPILKINKNKLYQRRSDFILKITKLNS